MYKLDDIDKSILNIIQSDFPLAQRPYLELARTLELTEDEVYNRVIKLYDKGYIRRLGGVFDSKKLGFVSTLVALKVDKSRVDEIAHKINEYYGVTHNYKRDHEFNIWFTLTEKNQKLLDDKLQEISLLQGVHRLLKLPATILFKIGVNFQLKQE
ncbi:AsnC family transcriptional regulator [Natranaerobius trueperi]|nr:AsnC family transcriptional regulator [Natranaerobius trueperi]